jgi:hypothetical protein
MRPLVSFLILAFGFAGTVEAEILFSGEKKLNNLVSELLDVSSISGSNRAFTFTRSRDGWIFVSSSYQGNGTVSVILDQQLREPLIAHPAGGTARDEVMRYVTKGEHIIEVRWKASA